MKKVKLIYDPFNGTPVSDGKCERTAMSAIHVGGTFVFSNALFFDAFRVQVKRGLIKPEDVEVYFKDNTKMHKDSLILISLDKNGRCSNWPQGFCDSQEKFLMELIDCKS